MMICRSQFLLTLLLTLVIAKTFSGHGASTALCAQEYLPGTELLTWEGDLSSQLVDGVDKFLLRKLAESQASRARHWNRDTSSPEAYDRSVAPNRASLAHILGLRDQRDESVDLRPVTRIGSSDASLDVGPYRVMPVRWNVMEGLDGSGLLMEPKTKPVAQCIVVPDASQSAEELVQLDSLQRLAASGCRVLVPAIVSRQVHARGHSEMTDREYLYRSAFELGRHLIGYELQKILAALDAMVALDHAAPVAVAGWGDGGMLSLYAGALDTRIACTLVSGYFGPRESMWKEPLDRNVFGLLDQFGDAELASLVAPRTLLLDLAWGPTAEVKTRGGAPYTLSNSTSDLIAQEVQRSVSLTTGLDWSPSTYGADTNSPLADDVITALATTFQINLQGPTNVQVPVPSVPDAPTRVISQIDQFSQRVLESSLYTRKEFFSKLDVSSLETHSQTVEAYRGIFRQEVIGEFSDAMLPAKPRTRKVFDEPNWTGYEVVLDVFPDVFAFGILLVPKDLQPGERRPTVVCQHGLEGRPRDVVAGDKGAYHDFAAKLAERGFVTFAPQNLYIFEDRFRTLQRKANPLGKTLFSVIVPQHQQIVDWLATLPQVDPDRIAFYGLSYGGKSAMRIPPLVSRYCLSICSADFNDWVWKNASTLSPYSYVWTGEYEIFEWDLGSTFNYSEMAALIAPRPFMVERGHFDGVAPDERVAFEFAKVRHLYQAKLGIGDRCEIEWFVGPHTINGKGTFDFLHRHLNWPDTRPK